MLSAEDILLGTSGISAIILSLASVVFAAVSWCALPKWRQFRHYAFFNVLCSFLLFLGFSWLPFDLESHIRDILVLSPFVSFMNWLMVITIVFYIEFAQVFTSLEAVEYLYLKVNIFCWLLPTALAVLYKISETFKFILAIDSFFWIFANTALYLCVLRALWHRHGEGGGGNGGKKVVLSTFAFVFTGVLYASPILYYIETKEYVQSSRIALNISVAGLFITVLLINLFFLMLKSHRDLWREYWTRKSLARLTAITLP